MSIPYIYQIEGCTSEFSAEINGYLFTVTLKLLDVPGDDDISQAFNALTDNNVPLIGTDLWNDFSIDASLEGCWLRNLKARPLGDHQWEVTMQYQHSPFNVASGQVQISSQTQVNQVESNKDKDGNPINTQYHYPADYGGDNPTEEQKKKRDSYPGLAGGTFPKQVPESTRTYTLRQTAEADVVSREYTGTTNNGVWQDGIAGTWMLASVTGSTDDSQQVTPEWVNSYTFQYRKDGWNPDVVHHDELTNEPVPDPALTYPAAPSSTAVGSIVTVEAYEQKDFTDLFPAVGNTLP